MTIKDFAFWIMIIAVITLCFYLINMTRTDAMKCLASPLVYGASLLEAPTEISCSCSSLSSPTVLLFNSSTLTYSSSNFIEIQDTIDDNGMIYSAPVPNQSELLDMGFEINDTVIETTSENGTTFEKL